MSTNESLTSNRNVYSNLDLPTRVEMALTPPTGGGQTANSKQEQKKRLEGLRKKHLRHLSEKHGKPTANWMARAYTKLDKAFMRGFYEASANSPSANDQTLDFDEFEDRDEDNLQEFRFNLSMVDDVIQAGFTVDSSLARTVYTRQRESKWEVEGERSMDGRARSNQDEAVLEIFGVPIPIAHVDYEVSARKQQQSQNCGEDIETRKARQAGRILREIEEEQMENGWGPTVEDSRGNVLSVNGYKDSEVAITGSASGDWSTATNIKDTVDAILNDLESQTTDNNRGPDPVNQGVWLYHHPNQRSDLRAADPDGDGNMTVQTRLERDYPFIDFRAAGTLNDGDLIAVVQDPRIVEVINAQAPTNLSEDVDFGLATQFKTLSSRVPFIKKTYDGIKGTVFYTGA